MPPDGVLFWILVVARLVPTSRENPMKLRLALLLPLAVAACADRQDAPTAAADRVAPVLSAERAEGQYIVVLKEGANPRSIAAIAGVSPRHVYTAALTGFSAELNAGQLNALQHNPNVEYVEADARVQLFTTQLNPYSWGLDRIDDRLLPLDSSYVYTATGAGVNAYILDSGIRLTHLDFVGRANYIPNGSNGNFVPDANGGANDCNGHGTHVAGTVGGTYSGVAKGVTMWAGRVVDCGGYGSASYAIAGVDWITANGVKPAVVNMSLGYGNVTSLRTAVENSIAAGFVYAVAAGNGDAQGRPISACNETPANAPNAITVGSTTKTDTESSFSNYGTCVDILAPGSSVMSSDLSADNALIAKSGTSMASPHVAGAAALHLSANPLATPAQVTAALKANASTGRITLHRSSKRYATPNVFLFVNY